MVALKRGDGKTRERRKRDGGNERERGDERLKEKKKKKGRYFGNKM